MCVKYSDDGALFPVCGVGPLYCVGCVLFW
jgi:hypothetical protein